MINTIRYSGESKVEKNGKKLTVPIPPQSILAIQGAWLKIAITHPPIIQKRLRQEGKDN